MYVVMYTVYIYIPLTAGSCHNRPTAITCHCHLLSYVELDVKSLRDRKTGTVPFPSAHAPRSPVPHVFNIFKHHKERCPKVKAITVQRNFLNQCTGAQSLFQRFRPGRLAGPRIH